MIVRMAVAVLFAVRFVVLVVVGDEIVQREAVVRGDEVDASPGFTSAVVENVSRRGEALRKLGHLAFIAFPVRAHRVAVFVIPFGPARRKLPDLVTAGTDVPWL